MSPSKFFHYVTATFFGIAGLALGPAQAQAEEPFPGAIQDAAGLACAPSCLLCHTTNPGVASSWPIKAFGLYMGTHGAVKGGGAAAATTAFNNYKRDNPAGAARIEAGLDPDTGVELCNGPTYGCGAHIAKEAPPGDASALLWALGAMVTAGVVRRRRPKGE